MHREPEYVTSGSLASAPTSTHSLTAVHASTPTLAATLASSPTPVVYPSSSVAEFPLNEKEGIVWNSTQSGSSSLPAQFELRKEKEGVVGVWSRVDIQPGEKITHVKDILAEAPPEGQLPWPVSTQIKIL